MFFSFQANSNHKISFVYFYNLLTWGFNYDVVAGDNSSEVTRLYEIGPWRVTTFLDTFVVVLFPLTINVFIDKKKQTLKNVTQSITLVIII